jgi:hypothetical protein
MSGRTTFWNPGASPIAMGAGDGPLDVGYILWATGYGPAYSDDHLETMTLTAGVNLRATFYVGAIQTILDPSNPTAATGWATSWGPYNGLIGQDPEVAGGFSLRLEPIDPNGAPPSGTLTFVGLSIVVSGLTNINVIHDTFHGPDNQQLFNHTPDEAPDPVPSGNIVGWHGRGAYANVLYGNVLTSGGNDGIVNYGRIWSGLNDLMQVYADIKRKSASTGIYTGVIARATAVPGNSDGSSGAHLELIQFWLVYASATTVQLGWQRQHNYGAGWIADEGAILTTISWASGASRRLVMALVGGSLYLFVADVGTGANASLVGVATPATPWNDSSHQYVGHLMSHYTDAIEMTAFGSLPLAVVAVNPGAGPGATIESLGVTAWDEQPVSENLATLEGGSEDEISLESLATVGSDLEGFEVQSGGGVEAVEGFEADAEPRWFPGPGGAGDWNAPAAPAGGWAPPSKPGGSWGPA